MRIGLIIHTETPERASRSRNVKAACDTSLPMSQMLSFELVHLQGDDVNPDLHITTVQKKYYY